MKKVCSRRQKIVPKNANARADGDAVTLVGTYKERQLAWIRKHGVYNYPVKEEDELKPESCAKVKELWLYASAKGKRHCFAAEFVGIQSKDEFLAANPTCANLGPSKHTRYMVFKTTVLDYGPRLEGTTVFARVSDFEKGRGRTKKIAAAIRQFHDGGDFGLLADYLPSDLAKLPHEQLRVCEAAVQLEFYCSMFASTEKSLSNGAETVMSMFSGGMDYGNGSRVIEAATRRGWSFESGVLMSPDMKHFAVMSKDPCLDKNCAVGIVVGNCRAKAYLLHENDQVLWRYPRIPRSFKDRIIVQSYVDFCSTVLRVENDGVST